MIEIPQKEEDGNNLQVPNSGEESSIYLQQPLSVKPQPSYTPTATIKKLPKSINKRLSMRCSESRQNILGETNSKSFNESDEVEVFDALFKVSQFVSK